MLFLLIQLEIFLLQLVTLKGLRKLHRRVQSLEVFADESLLEVAPRSQRHVVVPRSVDTDEEVEI